MWLNTSKWTSWVRSSKLIFFKFPKWLFFQLNCGAKNIEIGIAFWRYGNVIDNVITDWWEVDFEKSPLTVGNMGKVLHTLAIWILILTQEVLFTSNHSSNNVESKINIEDFKNMWHLGLGTIVWEMLILHTWNSKSSLPTTGIFRYVESHFSHDLL